MKRRSTLLTFVAMAATAFLVGVGGAANADNIVVDGDAITTNVDTAVAFGSVACGATINQKVAVYLQSNGHNGAQTQVFANGSSVDVTATTSAPLAVAVASGSGGDIPVPTNWQGTAAYPNNELAPIAATATVSLTAGTTAGPFGGTVSFRGTGHNLNGNSIEVNASIPVSWTVVPCTPTKTDTVTTVTCDPASVVYTGSPIEPCTATATDKTTGAVVANDVPVTYPANHTDVGSITATAVYGGDGTHNGSTGQATYQITPADADCTVTGYTGVYDGNAHGATGTCTGIGGADLSSGLILGDSFTDVPGGTANWSFTYSNYKDQTGTAPIVISPADADCTVTGYTGVYDGNAHGATGTCTGIGGTDLSSGLILGDSFTDVPGGTANWSFTYTNYNDQNGTAPIVINAWTLNGFFKPVDMGDGIVNVVKGGSTVPLKFTAFAGSAEITDLATLNGSFTVTTVGCQSSDVQNGDVSTALGGTSLRYDAAGGQWIQNWQTPKTAGKCYLVSLKTADGSELTAEFRTK